MQLFVDSADPRAWSPAPGLPVLAGATTNPSLVRQTGRQVSLVEYEHLVAAAQAVGLPCLMLQLPDPDVESGLAWSRALQREASAGLTLTFKLPCAPVWRPLLMSLLDEGFDVLLTAVSNPLQLLWAAECRATWVAPYLGRLEDAGRDPWPLVEACVALQRGGGPRLLAASVRTSDTLARLIGLGAAAVTLRHDFLMSHATDSLTADAVAQFARDARQDP